MLDYNRLTNQALGGQQFLEAIFDTLSFNQELVAMLGQSFDVHILSDNYRENINYISHRYHFDTWSKHQFYSFEYGLTKMDPSLYEQVLNKLNLIPDELFLIDDSPGKIQTAASYGIAGILYLDNAQVKRVLNL